MSVIVTKTSRFVNRSAAGTGVAILYGGGGGGGITTNHNSLTGLQGGSAAEYYHLTSAEYTGTGTGVFVRLDSPVFTTQVTLPATTLVPNGGSIGQAAGPLLTFDDTNNYLEITGCKVGIITTDPESLLDIGDDAYATTNYINVNAAADQQVGLSFSSAGTHTYYLYRPSSSNDLRFYDNIGGADRFIFTAGGEMAILTGGLHVGGSSAAGDNNLLVDGTAGITGNTTLTGFTNTVGGVHIGGAADPGADNLWIDGNAQEPDFSSGWQGGKWQITDAGRAEFDSMLIRGGLEVFELIINQLHYQCGGLIVGPGGGKVSEVSDATQGAEIVAFEDPEGNVMYPFSQVGQIVVIQRVDIDRSTVVKKIVRETVSCPDGAPYMSFGATTGWVPAADDVGTIEVGDEVVAVGHTSNTALDANIYMSAVDANNPFLRMYDGVNSYSKFSLGDKTALKLQIGNLTSLAGYDIVPASPGYGMYCDNVYLTGKIVANEGYIGGVTGWAITAGSLIAGTGATRIELDTGVGIHMGATAFADAPFSVTRAGALKALGIAELGTSTAAYGGFSMNCAIKNADIWENAYDGDAGAIHINRIGYDGGVTRFRDFKVYDGKGNITINVDGSTAIVTILDSIETYALAATNTLKVGPTASPALTEEGVIYADTDHHLYYYNGTDWVQLDN